jgi:molecular chaperone GrpE
MSESKVDEKDAVKSNQNQKEVGKEEMKKENPTTENKQESPKEPMVPESSLKQALEEAAKWKNEYYKAYADLDNLRKSLEKDHSEALKYRAEGFLENLLPALDSFYIALESKPSSEEAKNYNIGFQYIYNQIQNVLLAEGVKEVVPKVGDEFSPVNMHAVDTVESPGPANKVAKVMMKGYYLKDRLVRPAMVSVTKEMKKDIAKEPSDQKPLDNKVTEAHKA